MTQLREKRSGKKRLIRNIISIASCTALLAVIVIVIVCCTGILKKGNTADGDKNDSIHAGAVQDIGKEDVPASTTGESTGNGENEEESGILPENSVISLLQLSIIVIIRVYSGVLPIWIMIPVISRIRQKH